ncbi:MAG: DUF4838 domain-containing protein [Clostridia bacterium]|nr:DUF4838 domain-containing protein [Clostridia bacterium]
MAGTFCISGNSIENYRIIYSASASPEEIASAKALCDMIARCTDKRLEVKDDTTNPTDHEIVIGTTNRDTTEVCEARAKIKNDGYAILARDNRLFITGTVARGAIYGVYEIMEKFLGARFVANDFTVTEQDKMADIPCDYEEIYSPWFLYRSDYWYGLADPCKQENINFNYAMRVNCGNIDIKGVPDGINYAKKFVHTLSDLAEIPHEVGLQPCLTDEKTFLTVRKNVRNWLDENPDATIISVSQNDSYAEQLGCQCEKCKAIDDREGTPMGSLLTFVNRIADDIKEDYPGVYVDTLAYRYTRKRPKTIVPRDNVIIRLCSIECCFCHPLDDGSCEKNVHFSQDIREWSEICKTLFVWDYTTDFLSYMSLFPNLKVLRENVQFFKNHNVIGLFEQGNYESLSGEFGELRAYLLSKLLWNPDMTEKEYYYHMDEFLRLYYGNGWKYIRTYIDKTVDKARERHLFIYDKANVIFPFENPEDAKKFDLEMLDLWNKAVESAQSDVLRNHCRYSRIQALYHAQYVLEDRWEELNKEMVDAMREFGITKVIEGRKMPDLETYPDLR